MAKPDNALVAAPLSPAAPASLRQVARIRSAAPAIQTPPAAALEIDGLTSFFGYTKLVIPAGQSSLISNPGDFIKVLSIMSAAGGGGGAAAVAAITLQPDNRAAFPVFVPGFKISLNRPFQSLRVQNNSASNQVTVLIYSGYADQFIDIPGPDDAPIYVSCPAATPQSATLTRPANTTQYAVGDGVVDNAGTALSFGALVKINQAGFPANSNQVKITKARLEKSTASVTSAAFRLFVYSNTPVTVPVDNAPYAYPYSDPPTCIIDFPAMSNEGGTGGAFCEVQGMWLPMLAGGSDGSFKGILVAEGTYTPGSAETFRVTLYADQN